MTSRVLLAIDASAGPASVAVFRDDVLVGARRIERNGSAELLAPTIMALLMESGVRVRDLTAVIAGSGPGSFTGLRVAAALAKGLVRGNDIPLLSVPSLPLIAAAVDDAAVGTYLCVLDALRGEWFAQQTTHHADGSWTVGGLVQRLPVDIVRASAATNGFVVMGPPIDAAQQPDARAALRIGPLAVPRDSWEPDYGRLAEAQVVWEAAHARPLPAS